MEKENSKYIQGKPWKVEARFQTYTEAHKFRLELEKSEKPPEEIKIKHLSSSGLFLVKTRSKEVKKTKNKK